MPVRIATGTLQIRFDDEKGLDELVEALESLESVIEDRAA